MSIRMEVGLKLSVVYRSVDRGGIRFATWGSAERWDVGEVLEVRIHCRCRL